MLEEIRQNGLVNEKVLAMKKKDGTFIWCSVTATAHDENERIAWMDCVFEDITERTRADEENRILSFNRRFVEMWGIPERFLQQGAGGPSVGPLVQFQRKSQDPPVDGCVLNLKTALKRHPLKIPVSQGLSKVPGTTPQIGSL